MTLVCGATSWRSPPLSRRFRQYALTVRCSIRFTLLVQAVVTGVTFGIFYSLVHLKREPSFQSSFGARVARSAYSSC